MSQCASIKHAVHVIKMLRDEFDQSAVLVTYKQSKPSEAINQFRHANTQWIVSVGMVSEGTDIPRLQVCCHLSQVKTELYFRQVLGRILRMSGSANQEAWLYTFAEPTLTEFAHRIEQDLPDASVIINQTIRDDLIAQGNKHQKSNTLSDLNVEWDEDQSELFIDSMSSTPNAITEQDDLFLQSFEILGMFREQVIASFDSTF